MSKVYVVADCASGEDYYSSQDMPEILGVFTDIKKAVKCLKDFAKGWVDNSSDNTEHNFEDIDEELYFELTDYDFDAHVYADIQEIELK